MTSVAPMCGYTTRWTGSGRHRHSSGRNPTFRCVLPAHSEGTPHALERQPHAAPVAVAPAPTVVQAPVPIRPATLAKIEYERLRFTRAATRPLPTTERAGREELARMASALRSTRWYRHTVRLWLEEPIVSACACGATYDAAAWAALVYVGVQDFDGVDPPLELRNCTCGSTLAIWRLGSAS